VRHLIDLGHRRIACATSLDYVSSVLDRIAGYKNALKDAGIAFREEFLYESFPTAGETVPQAADRAAAYLMNLPEPPTAIFGINDYLAMDLCDGLIRRGVRVPEDISVAGFDGALRWTPGARPLTTADQNHERIGERAGELMIQRLSGEPIEGYRHVLIQAPLHEHGTTAPPKSDPD